MARRKEVESFENDSIPASGWDASRSVDELSPRELMAKLTADLERKMDEAFGRIAKIQTE